VKVWWRSDYLPYSFANQLCRGGNHSYNAATKNALDYLYAEWHYKCAGLVCYGGAARGTRAAHHLKPVLNSLLLVHAGDVAIGIGPDSFVDGKSRGTLDWSIPHSRS